MKIEIRAEANVVAQKAAMIVATEARVQYCDAPVSDSARGGIATAAEGLTQRVGLDLEIAYDGGYS